MKKIFFLLIIVSNIFAQSAGESGIAFLKFGFGARNIAMSDLGVASVNDLTALNYNPSLLTGKSQLFFSHNSLFQDLSSEMFAAGFNLFGLPIAVGATTTSISNIEVRTMPGDAITKINAHYFSGSVSTKINIVNNFNAGITIKYLYENLFSNEANGYGFDFGVSYQNLIEGLTLGASIKNIGSMNELRLESTKLPVDFRIGGSYNFTLPGSKFDFVALAGFQKYILQNDSHFHLGAETVYNKSFSLRLGFASGYDTKSITAGFGILLGNINTDYAYVPMKYSLGDSHIITFIYSID